MSQLYGPNTEKLLEEIANRTHKHELSVPHLKLTGLPELPDEITYLNCCHNPDLKVLPKLPPKLKYLICGHTGLTSLPKLPTTLLSLDCSHTPITSLPGLHSGLHSLHCDNTQIEVLPKFPNSLSFHEGQYNLNFSFTPAAGLYWEQGITCEELLRRWKWHWRNESQQRIQERCSIIKRELMERMWHPQRVMKLLEAGYEMEAL